jgi:hypothetical protein
VTRDTWLLIALGALGFSSLLASAGAWILLYRDVRARRGRHRAPR